MSFKFIVLKIAHLAQQNVKNSRSVVVHLLVIITKIIHDNEINQTLNV